MFKEVHKINNRLSERLYTSYQKIHLKVFQ